MTKPQLGFGVSLLLIYLIFLVDVVWSDDAAVMRSLKKSITNSVANLGWPDDVDVCEWKQVRCDSDNRVTKIQIGSRGLLGSLPKELSQLTALVQFEVQTNALTGPFPSLAGLTSLQVVLAHDNSFTSFPGDFFSGMSSLRTITIDDNPFSAWKLPDSTKEATSLQQFSANNASLTGTIPDIFGKSGSFPGLTELHMARNFLQGGLPASFAGSSIQSLWLNGQQSDSKLNGTILVLQNMTDLTEIWLHGNEVTGPIPDFSNVDKLVTLNLRDNQLTGIVPLPLWNAKSLTSVNLTNNLLQGPSPKFRTGISADVRAGSNRFCFDVPGQECNPLVNALLSIIASFGYPAKFAESWQGNDPCSNWMGIVCSSGNITVINFQNVGLSGTISPSFSSLTSLRRIVLSNNNISGTIPGDLVQLPVLQELDVSNNRLYGKVPSFRKNVAVKTNGNPDIGKNKPSSRSRSGSGDVQGEESKKSKTGVVVGVIAGVIAVVLLVGAVLLYLRRKRHKVNGKVQSLYHGNVGKINTAGVGVKGGGMDIIGASPTSCAATNDLMMEAGKMVIPIQVLREVTDNFSEENISGKGGFGTVYKGELHDGTKIAVKRMDSGLVGEKGLNEFKSEIAVLTKVRHKHLVALLGYCLDGNERLLVYEYMPQGTLSRFLFHCKEEGLKPLEWTRRLIVALDVARGVEYLHGLTHQIFIHRDLKPSNILLGDDMRAKVADFGLVRLAPEGKASFETKLAGTFGYLAPEYAATGRVTTKVDVYSFGVILMEIITGRKALDESQPEDSFHLVTWFRRMQLKEETFRKAIDPALNIDVNNIDHEGALANISKVAELAGHCCAQEPYQRPDMSHAVNVLSSLVELWKPSDEADCEMDGFGGIDLGMSLPQALRRWQAFEGNSSSSYIVDGSCTPSPSSSSLPNVIPPNNISTDNTQSSIPPRPSGFANSFTSGDGR